jgi:hypothetical protein
MALALSLSTAEAEPPSVVAFEKAMSCTHLLHPRLLLLALQRDGVIGRKAVDHPDGVAVFAVARPFRINGFAVKYVEGWDSDYRGHMFRRGPGTSPGRHIGVALEGDQKAVDKRFGILDSFKHTSTDPDGDWGMYTWPGGIEIAPGLTELVCMMWSDS